MDKEKIIHALKLANECTYADVMMDSAKDYLRNKLNEALLEIEQPTKQVSVPSEENKYHFARELLFILKSNGVPIPEQTYLYWIEKLIQDEKTYQSQPMKQADVVKEVYPYYASATDSIQDRKLDEILSILKRKENVLGHTPMELAQSFALFCWGKTITTELKTIEALFLRWIDECGILNGQKQS